MIRILFALALLAAPAFAQAPAMSTNMRIYDEQTLIQPRAPLGFEGAGVSCAYSAAKVRIVCTIASAAFTGGAVTTPITLPDGTAGAPSLSFTNYPTTGINIREGAPNALSFSTSGTEAGYFNATGVFFASHGIETTFVENPGGNAITVYPRLKLTGTAAVAGDFVLSAGWGTTASVGTITGDDNHLRFTVTSAGINQAATPTIAYTFKNGTWTTAPFCQVKFEDASVAADLLISLATQAASATVLTITWNNAAGPVATRTYTFTTSCIGI